jgi:hypothetical protein
MSQTEKPIEKPIEKEDNKLSPGAIAGIVIGSLVGFVALVFLIIKVYYYVSNRAQTYVFNKGTEVAIMGTNKAKEQFNNYFKK